MGKHLKTQAQLIVFCAGNEEFGVPIDAVREIIKATSITPIPNAPSFIKGIINVRGEIVTTISVKSLFSLHEEKIVESKHIVVTRYEEYLFGFIVDEVIEILRVEKNEIKLPPSLINRNHEKYLSGIISHEKRLILLLDLAQILLQHDLARLIKKQEMQSFDTSTAFDRYLSIEKRPVT